MSNSLALEDSPYLQQHKDNPFDWYPWCDEAFEKARNEHKAIFISIGYSSCHWCHVMEHDVFEDETIATFVNQHFICIKVDREERPDIDKHFQELHVLLNRRAGGWPLSIFCTPENKPFYAATYIPPHNRDRMMGFSELTAIIAEKVTANDEKLLQNADEIMGFMKPNATPTQATALDLKINTQFFKQATHNYDAMNGGFSKAPKFPHTSTLKTLMTQESLESNEERQKIITHTLDAMARGGMNDLIDGGFCRYSTEETWLIPHFEKMTYDNALLCELYARASIHFNNPLYARIATETANFMMKFMMEDDLFYSASDADTQGEEGKYFVYSYEEVLEALRLCGVENLQDAARLIGATPEGNFEGHCIITLESLERPEWFENFARECQKIRTVRTYPFIDRKINTAWNAMMIKALFVLGKQDGRYTQQAINSLNALLSTMMLEGQLYHTTLIHKIPKVEAFLEDYAYLANTLIEAYQCTFEEEYLIEAQRLSNKALELFYEGGAWYFSRGTFPTICELDDGSYPSALAMMVDNLLSLGMLVDSKYRHFAFKSLEYVSIKLMKSPIYTPKLTEQTIRYLMGDRSVKAPKVMLEQCENITHPFGLLKRDETLDSFLICGENSCFTSTKEVKKLNTLIASTL
ncbi:MAG: thioredoxin domain-containing protein [Campylobacterales bacterium]|nr:thioredoxin domain-containing protein [Campylobacterales bacterium]